MYKVKEKKVVTDGMKLFNLYNKIDTCGENDYWFIDTEFANEFKVPVFCNLKSCDNPDCIKHRGYLFKRKHIDKIKDIQSDMNHPYSYVFTGWVLDYPIDRDFVRSKFKECCRIVKKYSSSKYSVHMEIKIRGSDCYLHFHVLSNWIELKPARLDWKRQIKYEFAIKPSEVVKYVSKYASKTPYFRSELHREFYHLAVYKLIMHRFGTKVKESKRISRFQSLESLYGEVNYALRSNKYNWVGCEKGMFYVGSSVSVNIEDG